jgi:hypothetical protein
MRLYLVLLLLLVFSPLSDAINKNRRRRKNAAASGKGSGKGGKGADKGKKGGNPNDGALHLDSPSAVAASLETCWEDDFLNMFLDESCHLVWEHSLRSATVTGLELVSPVVHHGHSPVSRVSALKLVFDTGHSAIFKPCIEGPRKPSYKAEIIVHFVDRLLEVHRTPATVLRSFSADELSAAHMGTGVSAKLKELRHHCTGSDNVFTGSLMGWAKFPLVEARDFHEVISSISFSGTKPSQHQLEYVRLALMLLVFGMPGKLERDVVQLAEVPAGFVALTPEDVNIPDDRTLFIAIDNDEANWAKAGVPEMHGPVCDRSTNANAFHCNLTDYDARKPARSAGVLMSMVCTACIFPERIAEKIQMYSDPHAGMKLSSAIRDNIPKSESVLSYDGYDYYNLDNLVSELYDCLWACIAKYGRDRVLFAESAYENVRPAPKVHYSGNGHKYVRDDKTGVWRRVKE